MNVSQKEVNMLTQSKVLYKGVIEDNNDPLQIGRVRVRVLGIHSGDTGEVPTDTLPWCPVLKSLDFGGFQSGMGISSVPTQGSWVALIAESNDMNSFIVIGGLSGITKTKSSGAFGDPDGTYPKSSYLGKSDYNTAATGGNYLTNNVIETPSGHRIELDDSGKITITHSAGSVINMSADGNISITATNDVNVNAVNINMTATGTGKFESAGNMLIKGSAVTIQGGSTMVV